MRKTTDRVAALVGVLLAVAAAGHAAEATSASYREVARALDAGGHAKLSSLSYQGPVAIGQGQPVGVLASPSYQTLTGFIPTGGNTAPTITQGDSPLEVVMDEDGIPVAWAPPTLAATDVDGDTLTWSVATPAAHGTATVEGTGASPTTFDYAPTADYRGSDSFTVEVADGQGGTDTIVVNLTINPRNDAPVIDQGAGPLLVTIDEDEAPTTWASVAPALSATDADGDTLTWSVGVAAVTGAATVSGTASNPAVFAYMPLANDNGADSFTVSVSDGFGGAATIVVNVTITPRNDAPVNAVAPFLSGSPYAGQTLTANAGTWNDDADETPGTLSYAHQWRRADDGTGNNAADIGGETGVTYVVQAGDTGKFLSVRVTVTDDGEGLPATRSTEADAPWTSISTRQATTVFMFR